MSGCPSHPNGCSPRNCARVPCVRCCRNGVFHLSIYGRYFRPGEQRPRKHGLLSISSNAALTRDKELIEAAPSPAQMRRTSIYSIRPGSQRLGGRSKVMPEAVLLIPSPREGSVTPCPAQPRIV